MKKRFVTWIIILVGLSAISVNAVNGQENHKFEAVIPFPFVLEARTLPAGKYSLGRIDAAKPNVLMVKNTDAHIVRLLLTQHYSNIFSVWDRIFRLLCSYG